MTALAIKSLLRLRRRSLLAGTGFRPPDPAVQTSEFACRSSGGKAVETSAHGASLTYLGVGRPYEGAPHQFMAAVWLSAAGVALTVVAAADAATRTWQTPLGSLSLQPLANGVLSPRLAALFQLLKILTDSHFSDLK